MSTKLIDCKICKKRIISKVWKMHVVGKKHVHYTPKKITVTGNINVDQVDAVHQYFGTFGKIAYTNVDVEENGTVSIDYSFQDTRVHSKIIYIDHYLFDQPLTISWEEVTAPPPFATAAERNRSLASPQIEKSSPRQPGGRPMPVTRKIDSETSNQFIINAVREPQTFDDQLHLLYSKLQVDQAQNDHKKQLICDDLHSALAPMFPSCRIYFFGSSVTGLDVQGSDFDVYIENVKKDSQEDKTLKIIRNLIFKCRKFCDVLLISGAKIPLIKCIHTKTQMCCDLTIRNKLSVCNSQLIRYYVGLDKKIKILMITIKFWADCNDLKKVNFFSSYALYMMVIFYLQHRPYELPTVRELQNEATPELVDGWNCAFKTLSYSNPALENEYLPNLVAGFFRFYSNFDYTSKVISPYFGVAIDKTCFLKPYDLADYEEYKNKKQDLTMSSGICVQDPFEHTRNVTASVPFQCVGRFVVLCQKALNMIERDGHDLLYNLLTHRPSLDYTFCLEKPDYSCESEWVQKLTEITMKVLTKICGVKMVKTMNTNPIIYTCSSEQNIWDGRVNIVKNLIKELPPETLEIDREIAATRAMTKYLHQTLPTSFSMDMNFKQDPCRVEYTLKPLKKCKDFLHASHFFRVRLEKYLTDAEEREIKSVIIKQEPEIEAADGLSQLDMTIKDETMSENDKNDVPLTENTQNNNSNLVTETETNEFAPETSIIVEKEELLDEEDVPADFFDDFSNQDFMDGLDIVDAWDDDKLLENEEIEESVENKRSHSPVTYSSKSPDIRKKRSGSKSRNSDSNAGKRTRSRSHEKPLSDRRDPEKTRRDIHRDKLKCAKDREKKLVDDKLKIVETGLVPPGMEMETDLSTILPEKRRKSDAAASAERFRERKLSPEKLRDRELRLSTSDKARILKMSRERDRRYARRSASREGRKLLRYSPNLVRKARVREREPVYRLRKRTASVESNISDREKWIRKKRTRSRSRSRDSLHRHTKSKKYEEKKKKTFLEEIRDKLNETRPLPPVQPVPLPYNMTYNNPPAPVPAPQYFPPQQNSVQYDQSFFIGDAYPSTPMNQQMGFNTMNSGNVLTMGHSSTQEVQPPPAPVIKPQAMISPKINVLSDIRMNSGAGSTIGNTEDIGKLFADKKISLSDFLTITAKCEVQSSSPEHLQKKIKVISRCQDAIKAMSDDHKFTGRLTVWPTTEQRNKNEVKYQSPLRRIPVIRFQFTTPSKNSEDSDKFASALDKILLKIGVLKESFGAESSNESVAKLTNYVEETAALTLKASILKAEARSECEECNRRKAVKFADVAAQCVDNKETVSIGIQVTEDDLSPMKGLAKNDSIAYLTPAQLLGKDKDKAAEKEPENKLQPTDKVQNEPLINSSPMRQNKPGGKPPTFNSRGGFRKNVREQTQQQSNYYDFEYEYEDEGYDFYDRRPAFEESREPYGRRYGDLPAARPTLSGPRFPRQFIEDEDVQPMPRVQQFQGEGNYTSFSQSYRGRGGRYGGPRY